MKRLIVLAAVMLAMPAFAAEPAKEHHAPITNVPPAFERLKGLVGSWQGVGTGMEQCTTSFELMANGSALMERLAMMGVVMVNLYHPDGDAVVMTHYCASGNQPRMRCTKDDASLAFAYADITNWKKGDARMSGVTVTLVDADHMKQEWVSEEGGKSTPMTMEFVRKK